jgi:hypothetical protein
MPAFIGSEAGDVIVQKLAGMRVMAHSTAIQFKQTILSASQPTNDPDCLPPGRLPTPDCSCAAGEFGFGELDAIEAGEPFACADPQETVPRLDDGGD